MGWGWRRCGWKAIGWLLVGALAATAGGVAGAEDRVPDPDLSRLPVAAVTPVPGASAVRPDTFLRVRLDLSGRRGEHLRRLLRSGRFGVRLTGGPGVLWLLPGGADERGALAPEEGRRKALPFVVSGRIRFDPSGDAVEAEPGTLDRYTAYTATLAVGDALEVLLRQDLGEGRADREAVRDAFAWSFSTGSAIGEPTHLSAGTSDPSPRVTDGGRITVSVTDDYGDPATMGAVTVTGARADGSPPSPTFAVAPATRPLSPGDPGAPFDVSVADHAAEALALVVRGTGPWPDRDAHTAEVDVTFRPGPPAHATLSAGSSVEVGGTEHVRGSVTDAYGNPVEDGVLVDLRASEGQVPASVATRSGSFEAPFTAPTRLSGVPGQPDAAVVAAQTETGSAGATVTVRVDPGQAASLAVQPASLSLTADGSSQATVSGTVEDGYGNAVLDGTEVTVALQGPGSVSASRVPTAGGRFSLTYTAGDQPGAGTLALAAGAAATSIPVSLAAPSSAGTSTQGGAYHLQVIRSGAAAGTITLTFDDNGVPVAGIRGTLNLSCGGPNAPDPYWCGAWVSPDSFVTGPDGSATVRFGSYSVWNDPLDLWLCVGYTLPAGGVAGSCTWWTT